MKALVYLGPDQMAYQESQTPTPGPGEVLVQIKAVGICGSDMHAYFGHDERRPAPLILGHEACGIAQSGQYGNQRVTVNPLVSCGHCPACLGGRENLCAKRQIISMAPRQGAFAEYLAVPESNLIPVPDALNDAEAALCEPMATSYHGVGLGERALDRPLADAKVLVLGGGAIGLSAALILRARGCVQITIAETNPLRRDNVAKQNISARQDFTIIDPLDDTSLVENTADLVIDAVGMPATRHSASLAVRPGGVIVHIGLQEAGGGLDVRKLTLQEVSFLGCYTYTMADFHDTLAGMANGLYGALDWYDSRPLAEGAAAFADLAQGQAAAAKIMLIPQ